MARLGPGGLALIGALAAMAGSTASAASRAVEVENVRIGFQERYKVGTWTPVWIQLRGGVDGFSGDLELIAQDEDGTPSTIRQAVQVGPGGSQRVTAYVRPGSLDSDFATLRFIDGQVRPAGGQRRDRSARMLGSKPPEPLDQLDYQVVTPGQARRGSS